MTQAGVVLVTGASSGVGRATAQLLVANGYTVFGTSRDPSRVEPPAGVRMMALDVCADDSVAACVGDVLESAGRIDVLFNNAGFELAGAIEECTVKEAREQFETNFFGVHRMVRAVLPGMRAVGKGHIINMSSLAGLVTVPYMGLYSASKFALESYSEALRLELRPLGVAVSAIEVGFLNTPMKEHRRESAHRIDAYDPWRERTFALFLENENKGLTAERVARRVLDVIRSRRPGLRNLVGAETHSVAGLRRWLPEPLYEMGMRKAFRLGDGKPSR